MRCKSVKPLRYLAGALLWAHAWHAHAEDHSGKATLKCVADTSINAFPGGGNENNEWKLRSGEHQQIKIKNRENMLLLRFDMAPVPPKAKISSAKLRLHLEGGEGYALNHVCVSTVPTEWDEKTANFLEAGAGKPWGPSNLHFCAVTFGNFGTVESVDRAKKVEGGWWEVPVSARVVHAMRDSFDSLSVMDETGIFKGKFANIFISSRETQSAPELCVTWAGQDSTTPSTVKNVSVIPGPDAGSVFLDFNCGGNDGDQGAALGYEVRYCKGEVLSDAKWPSAAPLPRVLIKRPLAPGAKLRTFLEGLEPGAAYSFGVIAYDESGNRSPPAVSPLGIARSATDDTFATLKPIAVEKGAPIACGSLSVWALDALQQLDPVQGKLLVGTEYVETDARNGNAGFDGKKKLVALTALKGEQADFQIILESAGEPIGKIRLVPGDLTSESGKISANEISLGRIWYLKVKDSWYPNTIPLLKAGEELCIPAKDNVIEGQKIQSVYANLFVPYDAAAGEYKGTISIESSAGSSALPVVVRVINATMPKRLNFEIELNQYTDRQPVEKFHELHRIAHLHRVGYNVLPYSHNGTPTVSFVPPVEGFGKDAKVSNWISFDSYLGPLLDGSAFKNLPRASEPIRWSYLPFYENYPMPLYKGYARADLIENRPAPGDKEKFENWRDRVGREEPLVDNAFSAEWLEGNRSVVAQFMKHFEEKGWTNTKFHVMCNNVPFKGTLTSWTLDEPAWGRDFRALALFYKTFVQAARASSEKVQVVPRNGISRPQWQGDRMDEVSDFNDISGNTMGEYYALIRRRMLERGDTYWIYGGGINSNKDLAMFEAYVIQGWCRGQIGILPAWTAFDGGPKSWDEDKNLALVVPGAHGYEGWTATMKLKALRRAQQDAELLDMLAARPGWDRWRVARAVTAAVNFASKNLSNRPEDAASADFSAARQEDFTRIRRAVGELLAAAP